MNKFRNLRTKLNNLKFESVNSWSTLALVLKQSELELEIIASLTEYGYKNVNKNTFKAILDLACNNEVKEHGFTVIKNSSKLMVIDDENSKTSLLFLNDSITVYALLADVNGNIKIFSDRKEI